MCWSRWTRYRRGTPRARQGSIVVRPYIVHSSSIHRCVGFIRFSEGLTEPLTLTEEKKTHTQPCEKKWFITCSQTLVDGGLQAA